MPDLISLLTGSTAVAFAATVALAFVLPRMRARQAARPATPPKPVAVGRPEGLPVEHDDPDWRECVAISRAVADLMIADEWIEIADKIAEWEAGLDSTPGGVRYHDLAVRTCLSGLEGLIEDAPRSDPADLRDAAVEVGHFMDTHRQTPDNHILALLAARAHIALGHAYGEDVWPAPHRKATLRRMAHHYIAAGRILDGFDAVAHMSPLLAEAHYRYALGTPGSETYLAALFHDWIDLDPSNSTIYDVHVSAMVERDLISGDDVLREADEAMQRTENTLGFGGYALFFMPLLTEYDSARDLLDPELFATALLDLASNSATQAEVNHAAAALLTEMESSDADTAAAFRDTLILLMSQHLEVIYPRFWPISVEEIRDLAAEAAEALPELDLPGISPFDTPQPQSIAA